MGVALGPRAEKCRGSSSSGGPDFGEWRTLRSGPSCAMDHPLEDAGCPQKTVVADSLSGRGLKLMIFFRVLSRSWGLGASS